MQISHYLENDQKQILLISLRSFQTFFHPFYHFFRRLFTFFCRFFITCSATTLLSALF